MYYAFCNRNYAFYDDLEGSQVLKQINATQ